MRGRNNWIVWTAGNDRFWDQLSSKFSYGTIDLLKTISSHQSAKYGRHNRWQLPRAWSTSRASGRTDAAGSRPDASDCFGSTSAYRDPELRPDPFENEEQVSRREDRRSRQDRAGRIASTVTPPAWWVFASSRIPISTRRRQGALGRGEVLHRSVVLQRQEPGEAVSRGHVVRLLPRRTEPVRIRPPIRRIRRGRISTATLARSTSGWTASSSEIRRATSFPYQLFHTSRPGALDTSFVSSDHINNPRTMNAIYNLGARLEIARKWGSEELAGR